MEVKIINRSKNENPTYATEGASGFDLRANLDEDLVIKPMERFAVPTGLFIEIPLGYEGQIRARSGMSLKHGITMANGVGTIDSDYRGEIKVLIVNISDKEYESYYMHDGIHPGWKSWLETDKALYEYFSK